MGNLVMQIVSSTDLKCYLICIIPLENWALKEQHMQHMQINAEIIPSEFPHF